MCELWEILRGELDTDTAERLIARVQRQLGGQRLYIPTSSRPSKRAISDSYASAGDWREVSRILGVSRRTVYRYR